MDHQRFATFTKAFAVATTRREALKLLVLGVAAGLLAPLRPREAGSVRLTQHIIPCETVADCLQRAADAFHEANVECAEEYKCRGDVKSGCYPSKIGCYINAGAAYNADKNYCHSQGFANRGGCPVGWHCSEATVRPDFEGPVIDQMCCKDGEENCGAGCVDTLNNDEDCGACGNACPQGQSCANGECVGCTVDLDCNPENCEICDQAIRSCASRCDPTQCKTCDPATGTCADFFCPEGETCDACGCLPSGYKRCPDHPGDPCYTCQEPKTCDECGCLDPGYKRCPEFPGDPCFTCQESKTCDQCGCLDPGYKRCPNHPSGPCSACREAETCDRCGCLPAGYKRCPNYPGDPCFTCAARETCDECGCLIAGYTRCADCSQCAPHETCGGEGGCVP